MSAQDELRQAIQMMQSGQVETAVNELNRLANSPALDAKARAAALVWLAESRADRNFKLRCLKRALELDPENAQIRQGLQQLSAAPALPSRLPNLRDAQSSARHLQGAPTVVGIIGGANGLASGAFIDADGLLATTSYAVGGVRRVTVHVRGEQPIDGAVVRRQPQHDLALITTSIRLARKPAIAPPAATAHSLAFSAYSATGTRLRGHSKDADRSLPSHWLTTNIHPIQMPDAGGNPLYDGQGQLIGILTRNRDSAGEALAVNVARVLALAEAYRRERQLLPHAGYCSACGSLTQAGRYGGGACETCGAALPADTRRPTGAPDRAALARLYGEDAAQPCIHCGATVGAYAGRCLRCGRTTAVRAPTGG
ncbi:MAG: trypsin-like peptidase domain-containing protein [Chloroflexi bacterium]|nr:trypsin-like peptidase domain-containing protein [Chloroflexota bacterium]